MLLTQYAKDGNQHLVFVLPTKLRACYTSEAFYYTFDHEGADMNQDYGCDEVSSRFARVDYMFCEAGEQLWETAHWYHTVVVLGRIGSERH